MPRNDRLRKLTPGVYPEEVWDALNGGSGVSGETMTEAKNRLGRFTLHKKRRKCFGYQGSSYVFLLEWSPI